MASIIDSFREVFTDRFSFLKIIVFAIPVYYSYQLYITSKADFTQFYLIAGLTIFFLLGFLARITNNVINDGETILPSLNPFKLAFTAIKTIVAVMPSALIFGWLANYACSFINFAPEADIALKIIIWLIAAAIIVTSFLMFVKDENILDAFNIRILFEKAGDLIVCIIVFVLQFVVINFIIMGFIGYALFILFGYGLLFDFFVSLAVVFNVATTGHYLAQLQYDNLGYGKPSAK